MGDFQARPDRHLAGPEQRAKNDGACPLHLADHHRCGEDFRKGLADFLAKVAAVIPASTVSRTLAVAPFDSSCSILAARPFVLGLKGQAQRACQRLELDNLLHLPESEWLIVPAPELRILPHELWDRVKARQ